MNEASSLLRATCSQFISTLEECMKFANTQLAPELYHPLVVPQPSDFVGTKLPHSHRVSLVTVLHSFIPYIHQIMFDLSTQTQSSSRL